MEIDFEVLGLDHLLWVYKNIPGINIWKLENALEKDVLGLTNYTRAVTDAGKSTPEFILRMQDRVLKHACLFEMVYFAQNVPECDRACIQEAILKRGDVHHKTRFASSVLGADIPRIQAEVIRDGNVTDLIEFIQLVPKADVVVLQEIIMKKGTPDQLADFAEVGKKKNIPEIDVKKITRTIIEKQNIPAAFQLLRWAEEADQRELQAMMVKHGTAFDLISLAKRESCTDVGFLQGQIIASGNIEAMIQFAVDIKDADCEILRAAIVESLNQKRISHAQAS